VNFLSEMSGPRITRKVTVEVSKKVTDVGSVPSSVVQQSSSSSSSYNPRRSVFERLGPGAVDVSYFLERLCCVRCIDEILQKHLMQIML
jgi:hypothetical protein